jgi:hypothetical protein
MNLHRPTLALLCAAALAGCGGGNPPDIANPGGPSGQKLAFAYFQKCIQPLLSTPIPAPHGGGSNTCASGGCHDNVTGTGGALRLTGSAPVVDLALAAEQIRASEMYRNYYSAQGVTVPGNAAASRLLAKPLLLNVLHGGGQILTDLNDPVALRIRYWIEHPAPQDQDEFSTATYSMFTPADPATGQCNTP